MVLSSADSQHLIATLLKLVGNPLHAHAQTRRAQHLEYAIEVARALRAELEQREDAYLARDPHELVDRLHVKLERQRFAVEEQQMRAQRELELSRHERQLRQLGDAIAALGETARIV